MFSEVVFSVTSSVDSSHGRRLCFYSAVKHLISGRRRLCVTPPNDRVQLSQNDTKRCAVTIQKRPISFKRASNAQYQAQLQHHLVFISLGTSTPPPPSPPPISLSLQHFHLISSGVRFVWRRSIVLQPCRLHTGLRTALDSMGRDSSASARGVVLRSGCNQKFCRFQLTRALLNGLSQASVHPVEAVRCGCMTAKVAGVHRSRVARLPSLRRSLPHDCLPSVSLRTRSRNVH